MKEEEAVGMRYFWNVWVSEKVGGWVVGRTVGHGTQVVDLVGADLGDELWRGG